MGLVVLANNANEGHIMCKLISDVPNTVEQGKAFMQGIILKYHLTEDDASDGRRNGGFGSTGM